MFQQKLDIENLYDKGFCLSKLDRDIADQIFLEMHKETFIDIQTDKQDKEEPGKYKNYYSSRYIAARSVLQPKNLRPVYQQFADEFIRWSGPIIKKYKSANQTTLSVFCGVEGYQMGLHNDVGDRSVFDVIVFFGHDIQSKEDGGVLNLYNLVKGDDGKEEKVLVGEVVPQHGLMVVVNNLNPMFCHEVTELKKKGAKRFQFIGNYGMLDCPDWRIDYKEIGGFVKTDEPMRFNDLSSIVNLLASNPSAQPAGSLASS